MQNGGEAEDKDDGLSLCYFKNGLITHLDTHAFLSIYLILLLLCTLGERSVLLLP